MASRARSRARDRVRGAGLRSNLGGGRTGRGRSLGTTGARCRRRTVRRAALALRPGSPRRGLRRGGGNAGARRQRGSGHLRGERRRLVAHRGHPPRRPAHVVLLRRDGRRPSRSDGRARRRPRDRGWRCRRSRGRPALRAPGRGPLRGPDGAVRAGGPQPADPPGPGRRAHGGGLRPARGRSPVPRGVAAPAAGRRAGRGPRLRLEPARRDRGRVGGRRPSRVLAQRAGPGRARGARPGGGMVVAELARGADRRGRYGDGGATRRVGPVPPGLHRGPGARAQRRGIRPPGDDGRRDRQRDEPRNRDRARAGHRAPGVPGRRGPFVLVLTDRRCLPPRPDLVDAAGGGAAVWARSSAPSSVASPAGKWT